MGIDAAKIRRLRLAKGITQQVAADRAGLSGRSKWSDIEAGRRANLTIEMLEKVATALGVKAKDLLK